MTSARRLGAVTVLVDDYDAGIAFFRGVLGFRLVEDTTQGGGRRWVTVAASDDPAATRLLLARPKDEAERAALGRQAGGRVGFFLETDDFPRDHARMLDAGVRFREAPRHEPYGTVAVFEDPWGNPWDLIQPAVTSTR